MRYVWMLFLTGCIPNVNLFEVHSNWSEQEVTSILNRQVWEGMTQEQMSCSLGLKAYGGRHIHLDPSSYMVSGNIVIMRFEINNRYWYTGYFNKNGRLQILYDFW